MKTPILKFAVILLFMILSFAFGQTIKAQSALDGFDANISGNGGRVYAIATQPDGKILIGGDFTAVGGVARKALARLNPDATLDTTFNAQLDGCCTVNLRQIIVLSSGKILIAGTFGSAGQYASPNIARLNADGSPDTTFVSPLTDGISSTVTNIKVQSSGKIIIAAAGSLSNISGTFLFNRNLVRLGVNGAVDTTFDTVLTGTAFSLSIQADDKIIVGGTFSAVNGTARGNFARLSADGQIDPAPNTIFDTPVLTTAIQADGKILAGGNFAFVNGQPRAKLARLNPDGSLETAFNPPAGNAAVGVLLVQSDGRILAGGDFTVFGGQPRSRAARFNPDGTLDSFNPNFNLAVYALAIQADNKILIGGEFSTAGGLTRKNLARVYENGALDATLNPDADGPVYAVAVQPDDKILIGGQFITVGGTTQRTLARLNADGTLDAAFNPLFAAGTAIYSIKVLSGGKILVGGQFGTVNGHATVNTARLNSDGSADTTFSGVDTGGSVVDIEEQSTGKLLICGGFGSISGQNNRKIIRLNPDGTHDTSFNVDSTQPGGPGGDIRAIALQADGKILVGGNFYLINGSSHNNFARLDTNGAVDMTFNPSAGAAVQAVTVQPDGKIVIGGYFTSVNSQLREKIARVLSDGTLDAGFNPSSDGQSPGTGVLSLNLQADGKVLAGGDFNSISGQTRNKFARFNATGTIDNFNAPVSSPVYGIALQEDGKIVIGGVFTSVNGQPRNRIARLTNDTPAAQTLSVSPTTVSLTLSGAGPQLARVVFEQSTDGVNYTFLGEATASSSFAEKSSDAEIVLAPTATQFTLTGLNLPPAQNLFIRARGFDASNSEVTGTTRNAVIAPGPTAASVSISGRVFAGSKGLVSAQVKLTGTGGQTRTVLTNAFGNFTFNDVEAGATYVVNVSAKKYTFAPQVVSITDNVSGLTFTAQ